MDVNSYVIVYTIIDSPIGKLLLAKSQKGLNHIIFEYQIPKFESIIFSKFKKQKIVRDDQSLLNVTHQLNEYFTGYRKLFKLKLDL